MLLTDVKVRAAKGHEKPYKLSDSGGLFLLVTTNGSKYWRFKYRFQSKEKLLAIGVYPTISLAEAREKRDQAKKQIANGVDPSVFKRTTNQTAKTIVEGQFEFVAREWHLKNSKNWTPKHGVVILRRLENYVFPFVGAHSIAELSAPQLLTVLRRIENKGALETAHRVHQICGQVFRYAIATGRASRDLTTDLKGAFSPIPSF